MTNDLALNTQLTFEQIAKFTGQQVSTVSNYLPRMTISRDFEDDSGNQIPPGTFKVEGSEQPAVYGKPVFFRPYINSYQYSQYDVVTNKFPNKTIIFKSWGDEAIDELGGVRCGKIGKKQAVNLTEAQVAMQKTIKCYRNLYGTVTFTGVDSGGKEATLKDVPVLWRHTGSAFSPVGDALNIITLAKRVSFTHELECGLTRDKQGSNVYYIPSLKVDLTSYTTITNADVALMEKFQASIDYENEQVITKYKRSVAANQNEILDNEIVSSGMLDLNDELPLNMQ